MLGGKHIQIRLLIFCLLLFSVTVNAQERPKRIISLSPSLTEMLYAVNAGSRLVGVTRFSHYPPQVKKLPKIGGYTDPNYEAILALRPDLVLVLKEHTQAIRRLHALGIPVLPLHNESVAGILESIITLGKRVGHTDEARQTVARIKRDFKLIQRATRNTKKRRVLLVVGRSNGVGPIKNAYIAGHEDFYSSLIRMANGANAYQGQLAFPLISTEGMIELNPDLIIDVTTIQAPSLEQTKKTIQRWVNTFPKGQITTSQIHVLSQGYMVIPGPRINLIAKALAEAIHPKINWQRRWEQDK